MITVERLSPAWRSPFLQSRNSLFVPIDAAYLERTEAPDSAFPVTTYIARDESRVLSWAGFYSRRLMIGAPQAPSLRLAHAFAIGTLPEHRRQGLGRKVWQAAERHLVADTDGILIYTNEGGDGYPFYRSLGYLPLAFPPRLRLTFEASPQISAHPAGALVRTATFSETGHADDERGQVFSACYRGHVGFLAERPRSLDLWSRASFFYEPRLMGYTPKISWIERPNGHWKAYAIWAGPMDRIEWKKGAVEIWEIACAEDSDPESLRALLQPAVVAGRAGRADGSPHWWAVPGHRITRQMMALGAEESPRALCVLGRIFDPAARLAERLRATIPSARGVDCAIAAGGRVELRLNDVAVQIERDSALRLLFGRTTATIEHQHGVLSVQPAAKTRDVLHLLDRAFPCAPWAYFASEFI